MTIADKVFTLSPLTLSQERRLRESLIGIYRKNNESEIREAFRIAGFASNPVIAQAAAAEVVKSFIADPSWGKIVDILSTPEGAALDLWSRTRKCHPELTREQFAAVINETNCDDVSDQIQKAIEVIVGDTNPKA